MATKKLGPVETRQAQLRWRHTCKLYEAGFSAIPLCAPRTEDPERCSITRHFPCHAVGKRPVLAGYRALATRLPTESELLLWRNGHCNLGLVVPEGYVIVEADTPEADVELAALVSDVVTPTRQGRPGRGRAYLFRLPNGCTTVTTSRTHLGESRGIDALIAGRYLVGPPSIHTTGHHYEWAPERAPWECAPAVVPPALLARIETPAQYRNLRDAEEPQSAAGNCCDLDEVRDRLPPHIRNVLRKGFVAGGPYESPSELRLAIIRAAIYADASEEAVKALILSTPSIFPPGRDARTIKYQLARDYSFARSQCGATRHEQVRLESVCYTYAAPTRQEYSRTEAVFYVSTTSRELRRMIPVILASPRADELSAPWLYAVKAFPLERQLVTLPDRTPQPPIFLRGRRSRALAIIGPDRRIRGFLPLL